MKYNDIKNLILCFDWSLRKHRLEKKVIETKFYVIHLQFSFVIRGQLPWTEAKTWGISLGKIPTLD